MTRPVAYDLPLYKAGEELLFLREEKIRFMQDILFFIHHESQTLIEPILQEYGLGFAHFRMIQFVCHYPGLTIGELREILGITKQSLHRVLKEVLDDGYVCCQSIPTDRRKKVLFLTEMGKDLEKNLFELQRQQFVRAFREASNNSYIEGFQRILYGMVSNEAKQLLEIHTLRKANGKKYNAGK